MGARLLGTLKIVQSSFLETGISPHLGPVGELGMEFIYEGLCETDERGCRLGVSSLRELCEGDLEGEIGRAHV
jgi:hypothetical protein